jgi:hypothetical protein
MLCRNRSSAATAAAATGGASAASAARALPIPQQLLDYLPCSYRDHRTRDHLAPRLTAGDQFQFGLVQFMKISVHFRLLSLTATMAIDRGSVPRVRSGWL